MPPEDVPDLLVNQIVARVDDRSDHPAPSDSREADVIVPDADQDHIAQDDSDSGTEGNRFGDVLTSDRGPEFFGPSALLSFVKRVSTDLSHGARFDFVSNSFAGPQSEFVRQHSQVIMKYPPVAIS